jgi:hypothetical protein
MHFGEIYVNKNGRRSVVICENASYGGGSGPMVATEGEEAQIMIPSHFDYRRGVCIAVAEDKILFQIDGVINEIRLQEIERYDQFHLPSHKRTRL